MAVDISTAQAHLDAWMAADLALSTSQSYSITTPNGARSLNRANVPEVRDQINYWQRVINDLQARSRGGNARASIGTWYNPNG